MIARAEPTIYQVTSAINLMADDSPAFNFAENNFTVGYGAFGWNYVGFYFDDEKKQFTQ